MSDFPPIAECAFLSDCETSGLIGPNGSVEWLCLPRPDSPSVFGSLLDRAAGHFRLTPTHASVPSARRYLPGTTVLETTWCTSTGCLVVRDALVMGAWAGTRRVAGYRRPPGDVVAQQMLVRTAICVDGHVDVTLDCMPMFDYGRTPGEWSYLGEGYQQVRCTTGDPTSVRLTLSGSIRLAIGGARAGARAQLNDGERMFVALSWGDDEFRPPPPTTLDEADEQIISTVRYWRRWLQQAKMPEHPWRPHLERSVLTLKGLTYAPTGAIMAAATTSLPETPGGERNWDYRFTWVRDSSFLLRALYGLGFDWEAFGYFAFLMDTAASGPLQIMYRIDGERELDESVLDHLSGYEGARPVRIGNGAWDQRQHDMWGMVLDAVAMHVHRSVDIGPPGWQLLTHLVEEAIGAWREPDRGIWEVRGEPRHFTSSKVMCWVAVDRGARLAAGRGETDLANRWRAVADEIHADVCDRGVDRRGVFVAHYGTAGDATPALDASVLLVPLMGFLPPDDERVGATVRTIAEELTVDGLVLRYRADLTDDGLSGDEGTFTICSFWLVSTLAAIGEVDRARRLCERLLAMAGPLGLFAEEIDTSTGRHLGNYPQAFTHLALIDAVLRVVGAGEQ